MRNWMPAASAARPCTTGLQALLGLQGGLQQKCCVLPAACSRGMNACRGNLLAASCVRGASPSARPGRPPPAQGRPWPAPQCWGCSSSLQWRPAHTHDPRQQGLVGAVRPLLNRHASRCPSGCKRSSTMRRLTRSRGSSRAGGGRRHWARLAWGEGVTRMVRAPRRAEAAAASTPACPPPITTTSQAAVAPARLAVERARHQVLPLAAAAAAARARRLMRPDEAGQRLAPYS